MEKKLVDANVLLRYLLKDDETLFKKAYQLLEGVKDGKELIIIPESVLAECVYVLLRIYKVDRQIIAEKLKLLFLYKGVVNADKEDLVDSIKLFGQTNLSIVDCIICAKSVNNKMPIVTFDDELKNISRKRLRS
jgi:predicted nucleic-acid-binding protein